MLKCIMSIYHAAKELVGKEDFDMNALKELPVIQEVVKVKEIEAEDEDKFQALIDKVNSEIQKLA